LIRSSDQVTVKWVNHKKKKQLLCSWCLRTRIIGGFEFAIATGYPSYPVRHGFLNQSMSDYYNCYKIWQYINLSSRSWEEGKMTPFIYIYISASNWHRRCASTLLFLLSYTTPTSEPIDFKDLLIFYLISNIFFKNTLTLKNYCKHTTSSITTTSLFYLHTKLKSILEIINDPYYENKNKINTHKICC